METSGFLSVSNIQVHYGEAILAVQDVSLEVPQGSIVALFGANGAGKSTTLKAISNLLEQERGEVTQGEILFRGESLRRLSASDLVAKGIVQVLEGRHVFPHLTVEENLKAGGFVGRPSRAALAQSLEQVYEWFPRLKERRKSRAGLTSGGEQQMLAIGRALMTKPVLVLLDEPSMGLAPVIIREILDIIRLMNARNGVSFLIAEQNANLAMRYADSGYVLENGVVVASGTASELMRRDDIKEFYLGSASAGGTDTGPSAPPTA